MSRKRKSVSVTIRMNRDGTYNFRSTGGFDLRKLFPEMRNPAGETVRTTPGESMEAEALTETSSVASASLTGTSGGSDNG